MSYQEFDEDKILERFQNKKHNKKEKRYKGKKNSAVNINRIRLTVYNAFIFDDTINHNISIDFIQEFMKRVRRSLEEEEKLSLLLIKDFIRQDIEAGLVPSMEKIVFNSYCMELYNVLNNYNLNFDNKIIKNNDECKICFEDKDNFTLMKCNHMFCTECVNSIIEIRNELICPLCRFKTDNEMIVDKTNFIKPLSIENFYEIVNLTNNILKNHLTNIDIPLLIIYILKLMGHQYQHIEFRTSFRVFNRIKFLDEEQQKINDANYRIKFDLKNDDIYDN